MTDVPSNLIPTRITQLPVAPVADENSLMMIVYQGNNYQIRVGDLLSVAGVPITRQVIAGTGLQGGGQLSSNVTLSIAPGGVGSSELANSGVTPGVYGTATTIPVFTVDATGRVTAATTIPATISGYVPETRQIIAGTGLNGGGALNSNVTLNANLSNVAPQEGFQAGAAGVSSDISRADHKHPAVDLSDGDQVDNILGLSHGGTARSLVPDAGAIIWCGADGLYVGPVGVAGQMLQSNGAGEYIWVNQSALDVGQADNLNGGASNRLVYQTGVDTTGFVTAPVSASTFLSWNGSNFSWAAIAGAGTVTSVDVSGGTTGLTFSGGPVTSSGTITMSGALGAANGGLGLTSYDAGDIVYASGATAISKLTIGSSTYLLTSSGSAPQWTAPSSVSVGTASNVAGGAANRIVYNTGSGASAFIVAPTIANTYLEWSGSAFQWSANPLGTVTSVGLSLPSEFTISNSPVTTSGTLTGVWASQTANYFFAAPNGSPGTPSFRAMVAADVPTLNQNTTGQAGSVANSVTFNDSGTGGASPQTFNGSAAVTISRNTLGAAASGANSDITSMSGITGGISTADYLDFDTAAGAAYAYGRLYWSTTGTLNVGLGGSSNLVMPVGEVLYVYGKASATITIGEVVVRTGVVGASGVITFGPSTAGLTDGSAIVGIACENIASGSFGRIVTHGVIRGFDLSAYNDNDTLWYDPAGGGAFTATKPSAPNLKAEVGTVINNGPGGSGSMYVELFAGSQLGGTDSNVQITSVADTQLLQYYGTGGYWRNVNPGSVTGLGSVANAVTFNSSGGASPNTTYDGSVARTIDYSTVGAPKADGTGASGTWSISVSGNAATATNIAGGAASQIPYQTGAGATTFLANGTAGQVLKSNGASAPSWAGIDGGTF